MIEAEIRDREMSALDQTRAAHAAGRTLHEPEEDGGPCPVCDEVWPCAERRRQRKVIQAMCRYLQSDLYQRAKMLEFDPPGIRWESPLGWSVWMTYGHVGIPLTIRDPEGNPFAGTTSADVEYLDEHLP